MPLPQCLKCLKRSKSTFVVITKILFMGVAGFTLLSYVFSFDGTTYGKHDLPDPECTPTGSLTADECASPSFNYTCDPTPFEGQQMWLTYDDPTANFITFFYWVIAGIAMIFIWYVLWMDVRTIRGSKNAIFMPSAERRKMLMRHLDPPAERKANESRKSLTSEDDPEAYQEFVRNNPVIVFFLPRGYMRCVGSVPGSAFRAVYFFVRGEDGFRGLGLLAACVRSKAARLPSTTSDDLAAGGGGIGGDAACLSSSIATLCAACVGVCAWSGIRNGCAKVIKDLCVWVSQDFKNCATKCPDNFMRIFMFMIAAPIVLIGAWVFNLAQVVFFFIVFIGVLLCIIFLVVGFILLVLLVFIYQLIGHAFASVMFAVTFVFCYGVFGFPLIMSYLLMSLFRPTTVCKMNVILFSGGMCVISFLLAGVCGSLLLFDWLTWDVTAFVGLDPIITTVSGCECSCTYPVKNTKLYAIAIACVCAFLKALQLCREACYCDGDHSLMSVAYRVPFDKAFELRPGNPALDLYDMDEKNSDKHDKEKEKEKGQPLEAIVTSQPASPAAASESKEAIELDSAPAPLSQWAASSSSSSPPPPPAPPVPPMLSAHSADTELAPPVPPPSFGGGGYSSQSYSNDNGGGYNGSSDASGGSGGGWGGGNDSYSSGGNDSYSSGGNDSYNSGGDSYSGGGYGDSSSSGAPPPPAPPL